MSRNNQVGKHKTSIRTENGKKYVRYHNTDVVIFDENTITLNTGGYMSRTTKLRMNQTSEQYNLGIGIYQKNFEWFLRFKNFKHANSDGIFWLDTAVPFVSGMVLVRKHFGLSVVPFLPIVAKIK